MHFHDTTRRQASRSTSSHHGRCYQTAKSWPGKEEEPEEGSILEWNGRKERISSSKSTYYTTIHWPNHLNGNPAGSENRSSHIQGETRRFSMEVFGFYTVEREYEFTCGNTRTTRRMRWWLPYGECVHTVHSSVVHLYTLGDTTLRRYEPMPYICLYRAEKCVSTTRRFMTCIRSKAKGLVIFHWNIFLEFCVTVQQDLSAAAV